MLAAQAQAGVDALRDAVPATYDPSLSPAELAAAKIASAAQLVSDKLAISTAVTVALIAAYVLPSTPVPFASLVAYPAKSSQKLVVDQIRLDQARANAGES